MTALNILVGVGKRLGATVLALIIAVCAVALWLWIVFHFGSVFLAILGFITIAILAMASIGGLFGTVESGEDKNVSKWANRIGGLLVIALIIFLLEHFAN